MRGPKWLAVFMGVTQFAGWLSEWSPRAGAKEETILQDGKTGGVGVGGSSSS